MQFCCDLSSVLCGGPSYLSTQRKWNEVSTSSGVQVWFNVPVNNFLVISGRSHRFLGINHVLLGVNVPCSRTQHAATSGLEPRISRRIPMLYHYVTGVQINQLLYLHVLCICCTSHFCIWLMLARMATLLGKSWSLALHACYNILCNILSCSFFFLNGVYTGFIFLSYFPSGLRGATPYKHRFN